MPLKTDDEQDVNDALDAATEDDLDDADPGDDAPADDGIDPADDDGADGEGDTADEAEAGDAADGEMVVTIGDEQPEEDEHRAPDWLRDLRKANREKDRRIRELEARVAGATAQPAAVVVGEKPTLESCDFDPEKFEPALEAWYARKREHDEQVRQRQEAETQQRKQWEGRLDDVNKAANALKVKDAEDAAAAFEDMFSVVQQGIVLDGPDDAKESALLRYALGKNPAVAKRLASIQNPVRYAFAVAKVLYKEMNVKPRKVAPVPDKSLNAGSASVGSVMVTQARLDKLQEAARKSGDYTKYFAAKNAAKAKQAA